MQTLATRCPECGTSFRVQSSQLAASQGFVRCGRCDAVFDARLSLFDLTDGQPVSGATADTAETSPPPVELAATSPSLQATSPEAGLATDTSDDRHGREPAWREEVMSSKDPESAGDGATAAGRTEPNWKEPAWAESDRSTSEDPLAPDAVNERLRALLGAQEPGLEGASSSAATSAWSSLGPPPTAKPQNRLMTILGWMTVALLSLALPLQWAWTERASLRARSAGLDQLWRQVCTRCDAPAWAQIDGLRVGGSSLQPTPQGQAYHLQLTLHNGTAHPLALPWLDLRLQDAQGRVVVRRAVSPQELGARGDRLAAGGQLALKGTFRLQGEGKGATPATISGYEIGLFHP